MDIPAISVIVPLYNAEKYIGECLDSILVQTLQNFEVIVVDDCSTDNSVSIVESYAPKFGGRLTFMKLPTNSGTGGYVSRNRGLALTRGEYVFFMDADDFITKTALQELYSAAKEFASDVVQCEKYYLSDETGNNRQVTRVKKFNLVNTPTLENTSLADRITEFCDEINWHTAWLRLVSRDFLLKNEIYFPNVKTAGDIIWCIQIMCSAKAIVRIPNVLYIYRQSQNSNLRRQKNLSESIAFFLNPILKGLNFLDKFLDRFEFFNQNPQYRYALINCLMNSQLSAILGISARVPVYEVDKIFRQAFAEDMGEQTALISYLCSTTNIQRLQLIQAQQQFNRFNEFAAQAKHRIAELENEVKRLKSKE